MDFLSHLEELRRRLLVSLAAFLVLSIAAYFFSHAILDFLTLPLRRFDNAPLVFQKPYEAFLTHLTAAACTGAFLSSPVLFAELWLFVAPGLYPHEKRIILPIILASIALFAFGVVFGFTVVIPWGLHLLLSFQTESLRPMLSVSSYFSFLWGMLLAFGLLFDFPVIVLGLVSLGVVDTARLRSGRRVAIVLIFVAAAVLTPSPDPASQLLLAVPLVILFEVSLALARLVESRRRK